jgi:hypothetical protein
MVHAAGSQGLGSTLMRSRRTAERSLADMHGCSHNALAHHSQSPARPVGA